MRSNVTGRDYEDVRVRWVDATNLVVRDLEGVVYRDLADRTWIGSREGVDGTIRYRWFAAHAGGVVLKPEYELIKGTWINLMSGEEAPPLQERK